MAHLWLIYPLNMVIFHRFLYVYQMCGSGPGALHGRRAPWLGPQKGGRAWAIFPGPQTVTSLLVDQSLKIYKYIYHDIIIMISIIVYLSFCEIDRSWSSSTAT